MLYHVQVQLTFSDEKIHSIVQGKTTVSLKRNHPTVSLLVSFSKINLFVVSLPNYSNYYMYVMNNNTRVTYAKGNCKISGLSVLTVFDIRWIWRP